MSAFPRPLDVRVAKTEPWAQPGSRLPEGLPPPATSPPTVMGVTSLFSPTAHLGVRRPSTLSAATLVQATTLSPSLLVPAKAPDGGPCFLSCPPPKPVPHTAPEGILGKPSPAGDPETRRPGDPVGRTQNNTPSAHPHTHPWLHSSAFTPPAPWGTCGHPLRLSVAVTRASAPWEDSGLRLPGSPIRPDAHTSRCSVGERGSGL